MPSKKSWSIYPPASKRMASRSRTKRKNPSSGSVDTHAARELKLFITNDGDLYRRQVLPIIKNLKLKIKRGKYDPKLAVKLWGYLADAGAKEYTKQYGGAGNGGFGSFNKATRMDCATHLLGEYHEEVFG